MVLVATDYDTELRRCCITATALLDNREAVFHYNRHREQHQKNREQIRTEKKAQADDESNHQQAVQMQRVAKKMWQHLPERFGIGSAAQVVETIVTANAARALPSPVATTPLGNSFFTILRCTAVASPDCRSLGEKMTFHFCHGCSLAAGGEPTAA